MADIPPPRHPIPQHLPDVALPPYRYIPGQHPHPFRHSSGHQHDCPPVEVIADVPYGEQRAWLRFIDLFNHRYYWEAHEQLEALWKHVASDEPLRSFFQGLIQAAAFRLKWHMKHHTAANRLREAALQRLTDAEHRCGPLILDVHVHDLIQQIQSTTSDNDWLTLRLETRP